MSGQSYISCKRQNIPIKTLYPLELFCMNFFILELFKEGYYNILVISDLFSRLAVVVPNTNVTAEGIYNTFITIYWIPVRIHSDQGAHFDGNVIKQCVASRGWGNPEQLHMYVHHPVRNWMWERFNSTRLGNSSPILGVKLKVVPLPNASGFQSTHLLMF